jgi:type III pantothenate kinase
MNLLIDMGNTRLKWAVAESSGPLNAAQSRPNQHLIPATLRQLWQTLPPPQRIGIACVSTGPLLAVVESVARELWPAAKIHQAKSQAAALGVTNAYKQPEKLGVDRWLALIAAHHLHPAPVCIVDCGTAITVDLLAADGKHLGGYICPGLTLMRQALAHGTDALPLIAGDYPLQPARDTEAAIHGGTLLAALGLIRQVLVNSDYKLLLTGGDANLIAQQLNRAAVIDNALVLRGLALVMANPL